MMVCMATAVTPGQKAAARAVKARRGELRLTQRALAERAGVHYRTVQDFERGTTWPQAATLAQLERLGLQWPVGRIQQIADSHDENGGERQHQDRPPTDPLVAAVMASDIHLEAKLEIIDKLRATSDEPLRSAAAHEQRRLAELLGEEPKKSQGVA